MLHKCIINANIYICRYSSFFYMSDVENEVKKDSKKENPRIYVKIQDDFDYRVVSYMAKKRKKSRSGAVRDIIHQWILSNTESLKKTYGVDIDEINEEIYLETASLVFDKELKPLEVKLIDELPAFFEIVEVVLIQDLADHFGVPIKTIKKIIYTHAKIIQSKGLNLTVNEGRIFKRD